MQEEEGSRGCCPGAKQEQREAEDGATGALSTFHIWRNSGNNLPRTGGSLTDGGISEQSRRGCSQHREHPGAGNHLDVPQSVSGEQRGTKTSQPPPAKPSRALHPTLAPLGAADENKTEQDQNQSSGGAEPCPAPGIRGGTAAGTQTPPEVCILTTEKKVPRNGPRCEMLHLSRGYLPPAQLRASLSVDSSPLADVCQGYFINSSLFIAQLLQL